MNELKIATCLRWIDCLQNANSPIDALIKKGVDKVVVYGIADLGLRFVNEAVKKNYTIAAITDAKINLGDYSYRGIPVIRRNDLILPRYEDCEVVVTAMSFYEEIKKQLEEYHVKKIISLLELME